MPLIKKEIYRSFWLQFPHSTLIFYRVTVLQYILYIVQKNCLSSLMFYFTVRNAKTNPVC